MFGILIYIFMVSLVGNFVFGVLIGVRFLNIEVKCNVNVMYELFFFFKICFVFL